MDALSFGTSALDEMKSRLTTCENRAAHYDKLAAQADAEAADARRGAAAARALADEYGQILGQIGTAPTGGLSRRPVECALPDCNVPHD